MAHSLKLEMVALLPRLRGFARTLTGTAHDADDLVQQTCERVLSTKAGPAEGGRVDAWMFRIMRNLFIDGYRQRRPNVVLDDAMAESLPGQDGRVVTDARLELKAVRAVVGTLPEDQRSVLVLVCVEGLAYREVAEIMDIPIGTVMSRLARARAAISASLEGSMETTAKQYAGRAR